MKTVMRWASPWLVLLLVGATGIEPATFSSRTRRATRLRYAPLWAAFYLKFVIAQEANEKKSTVFHRVTATPATG